MTRRWATAALATLCATFCMGHEGGCHGEPGATRPTPVNALGVVLELEDGRVEARLFVRSDAVEAAAPVDGIGVAEVAGPEGAQALEAVGPGSYRAELEGYVPGAPYAFAFTVSDDVAEEERIYAGDFTLQGHGPMDRVEAWRESDAELMWAPGGMPVLVEVLEDGAVTWSNFAPLAEVPGWSAMAPGGRLALPEGLASDAVLRVCAVEVVQRDDLVASPQHLDEDALLEGQLGWLSGVVVGRCVAVDHDGG